MHAIANDPPGLCEQQTYEHGHTQDTESAMFSVAEQYLIPLYSFASMLLNIFHFVRRLLSAGIFRKL